MQQRTDLRQLLGDMQLLAVDQRSALVLSELKQEPLLYQRLLVDRNKNWLPKIEALFSRRGHALVVAGAAHLVGPDGVVEMLKARGYTVEQM